MLEGTIGEGELAKELPTASYIGNVSPDSVESVWLNCGGSSPSSVPQMPLLAQNYWRHREEVSLALLQNWNLHP